MTDRKPFTNYTVPARPALTDPPRFTEEELRECVNCGHRNLFHNEAGRCGKTLCVCGPSAQDLYDDALLDRLMNDDMGEPE